MSSSCRVVSSVTAGAKENRFMSVFLRTTARQSHQFRIYPENVPVLDICSNSTSSSSKLFSGRTCAVTSPDNCQGFSARADFSSSSIFFDICNTIWSHNHIIMRMKLWLVLYRFYSNYFLSLQTFQCSWLSSSDENKLKCHNQWKSVNISCSYCLHLKLM